MVTLAWNRHLFSFETVVQSCLCEKSQDGGGGAGKPLSRASLCSPSVVPEPWPQAPTQPPCPHHWRGAECGAARAPWPGWDLSHFRPSSWGDKRVLGCTVLTEMQWGQCWSHSPVATSAAWEGLSFTLRGRGGLRPPVAPRSALLEVEGAGPAFRLGGPSADVPLLAGTPGPPGPAQTPGVGPGERSGGEV